MELLVSLSGVMDVKTGMDRLERNAWFYKENKGGRVLCFYHYSFLSLVFHDWADSQFG